MLFSIYVYIFICLVFVFLLVKKYKFIFSHGPPSEPLYLQCHLPSCSGAALAIRVGVAASALGDISLRQSYRVTELEKPEKYGNSESLHFKP